ncbi:MAG: 2-oxo acid dehydrogenase subunit E2 [Chitinophagaceae bacterium]|nr:2-oxo acid dehydrogenase subunit E2 [Chitinophagaceae bacterium]MCZ2395302.1 2-oxo acid dehydrogenase subunit E2 [Chitinophagales bacterium]
MSLVDLILPRLGESIVEATILRWHKKPGDKVAMDESVLDIATDKVDSEVPSTADGIIAEVLYKENDVVPVGAVIARIETNAEAGIATPASTSAPVVAQPAPVEHEEADVLEEVPYTPEEKEATRQASSGVRFYSPLVLNIAASEGISMSELENIAGTGQDGRVSKKDILNYLKNRKAAPAVVAPAPSQTAARPSQTEVAPMAQSQQAVPVSYSGNVEIVEMDRMRKMIAKHMIDSQNTSAHVTSFVECDVTNMVLWREKIKKDFEKREGEKLTFTPLFIEAVIKSIKKYPWLNSSVDGERIIIKKDINIGMATAMPTGNLIVPVIKSADQLNLTGLARRVNFLANAARNNKLKPDDTADGTFTLTNVGTFGSIMGTPIINQPQVAILAVGAIKKRPVVVESEQGDSIAIRHMMYLSLSYDHRIIDGALGATFLNAVSKELENFDINRSW